MRLFKRDLSKLSDESLMGCVQDGDLAALDNLYSRYDSRLLHYFHRMLNRDEEKAQDFLQDLFVKIVERPSAFDTRQSFSTWIFTVAHNMCKNEYRRLEVRTRETTVEQLRMDRYAKLEDPDLTMDARAFKNAVLEALETSIRPSARPSSSDTRRTFPSEKSVTSWSVLKAPPSRACTTSPNDYRANFRS